MIFSYILLKDDDIYIYYIDILNYIVSCYAILIHVMFCSVLKIFFYVMHQNSLNRHIYIYILYCIKY